MQTMSLEMPKGDSTHHCPNLMELSTILGCFFQVRVGTAPQMMGVEILRSDAVNMNPLGAGVVVANAGMLALCWLGLGSLLAFGHCEPSDGPILMLQSAKLMAEHNWTSWWSFLVDFGGL